MLYAAAVVLVLLFILMALLLRSRRNPPPREGAAGTPKAPLPSPARPKKAARPPKAARAAQSAASEKKDPKRCLLCGEYFAPGDGLKTSLYPDTGDGGRLMEIAGCRRCAPGLGDLKRLCPLCGAVLDPEDLIMARRVESAVGRPQLTVLGCKRCYHR